MLSNKNIIKLNVFLNIMYDQIKCILKYNVLLNIIYK